MDAKKIVVVGGGPAGIMAAISASSLHTRVVLLEKNSSPARKLLLSGKGRSNITNACELDSFYPRFSKNGEFLRDAFKRFSNRNLMEFFQKRGLPLKVERQLRVFPVTDNSASVLGVLKKELEKNNVKVIYRAEAGDIVMREGSIKGVILSDRRIIPADKVILATGGISYRFTGSTGEGIRLAERLGHRIVPLQPGLVPLEAMQDYPGVLEGLTLKNIRLKFKSGTKEVASDIGELLFTKTGVSGPLVLSLSAVIGEWLRKQKSVQLNIDLKPALSREQLDARLLREFKLNPNRSIRNTLKALVPLRMVGLFMKISAISAEKKANQVNAAERQRLLELLKGMRLDIVGTRPIDEAMVTRGGVSLKDINPRTMESRVVKGLYFCGEMIDVDADTGGFNLQAAFSTGYLAGRSAQGRFSG
ncbi:MAG: NAD(P)/FAD-dependent oxidoreductase [Candidatus Omnitrophota bacterium]